MGGLYVIAINMPFDLPEAELEKTESIIGRLPEAYRNSMLQDNGGEAETEEDDWELYSIKDTSDRKRLSRTCNHIISETEFCKGFTNFPADAIAVAGNGTGDQMIFIKEKGQFKDSVYMWLHETGELHELADSFEEIDFL